MPNSLTGDFDAIVQVSPATANRLLASLHQNWGDDNGVRTLPHRSVIRIDDPGLSGDLAGVRGTAYVQLGAPLGAIVPSAPTDVDVSIWIRARYRADAGSTPLPEFVHAKVTARFRIEPEPPGAPPGLGATVSSNDSHITVTEHGLSVVDAKKIAALVRWFLRTRIDAVLPLDGTLPSGVAGPVGMQDAQGRQAVAFPVALGAAAASGNPGDVILGSSDFAMAVSKDFILSLVQPSLDALKPLKPTFTISAYGATAHYTVTISTAQATWFPDGRIRIHVAGKATTPAWWAPNVSFTVGQDLKLVFHFPAFSDGVVASIVPQGEVSATASAGGPLAGTAESIAKSNAKARFVQARENAIAQAAPLIDQAMARIQLLKQVLSEIDAAATLPYDGVEPGPDGIALRGRVVLSPRKASRIEFNELGDGTGYTAFDTWVPGGRVTSFQWTWWRSDYPTNVLTGGPEVKSRTHSDRFLLQEPNLPALPYVPPPSSGGTVTAASANVATDVLVDPGTPVWGQVCLQVYGEHTHPVNGGLYSVSESFILQPLLACSFALPFELPTTKKIPIKLLLFDPDPPDFTPILHVDLGTGMTQPGASATKVLVVAAAGDPAADLAAVREALQASGVGRTRLLIAVTTPAGPDAISRSFATVARQLQRDHPGAILAFAPDGDWTGQFDLRAGGGPALRFMDAGGRLAFRHDGRPDVGALAQALRQHLDSGAGPVRLRRLQPYVRPGDRAPDFALDLASGRRTYLRRLRGRPAAIAFAPPDAATFEPLAARLARGRNADAADRANMIVVLYDGGRIDAAWVRRAVHADAAVVLDAGNAVGQSYGIQARPTLVLVDRDGRVSTTQVVPALASREIDSPHA